MPLITLQSAKGYGWGAASAGSGNSFESIATVVVGASSVSSITFSSIPSTYKHLQVRYMVKGARTNNPLEELNLRFNGDTGNNYAQHAIAGDGSAPFAAPGASGNNIELGSGFIGDSQTDSQFGVGIVDILDYGSTTKTKTIRMIGGVDFNGAPLTYGGRVGLGSGLWNNTSATTSLTFYGDNADIIQYSHFALYGIKG
jgi:hypothetical protein